MAPADHWRWSDDLRNRQGDMVVPGGVLRQQWAGSVKESSMAVDVTRHPRLHLRARLSANQHFEDQYNGVRPRKDWDLPKQASVHRAHGGPRDSWEV